jgi:hypothetical protein
MPNHKILFAMGIKRGLAYMHPHLKHFYESSAHAKRATAHMLASGLHRSHHSHHKHHHHKMIGHGAQRREDSSEDEEDGKGLKHHKRRPMPLKFKF